MYAKRPNLTYLTQANFVEVEGTKNIALKECEVLHIIISSSDVYKKACLNIPKLVEAAEMLFDKTSSQPDGFIHLFVKGLLDDLRRE